MLRPRHHRHFVDATTSAIPDWIVIMTMRKRFKALLVLTAAGIATVAGLTTLDNPFTRSPQASTTAAAALQDAGLITVVDGTTTYNIEAARAALAAVPVAAPTHADTYDSDAFGQRWKDIDRNGCDQRSDLINRVLQDITHKPGTNDCKVTSGTLIDPYSGERLELTTETLSTDVQADHVLPKSWIWRQGAASWTDELRITVANDLDNLELVTSALNSSKGDSGPAEWMPPADSYRCEYTFRWVYLLTKYPLTINTADRDALASTIATCDAP